MQNKMREFTQGLVDSYKSKNGECEKEIQLTDLKSRLSLVFGEESPEKPIKVNLTSTRGGVSDPKDYEYALTHAQPDDKGLWFREVFSKQIMTSEQQLGFIKILREAIEIGEEELIRETVKTAFRYLWSKMGTGLSSKEIEEVVSSLDSFSSPLIVPVEKLGDNGIYLINETTGPTDAFKDLALQQVTTMLSLITKKNNVSAVEKAINDKEKGITYKFEIEDGIEKLIKYENGIKAQEQGNRPKISIVITQTSTSGDTGPAGGAGIEGRDFVANIIGFPAFEATQGQKGQMMNLEGNVVAIAFKQAFTEIQERMKGCNTPEFKKELNRILEEKFSQLREEYGFDIEVSSGSFNSVNIGRIDGQSIYHSVVLMIAKALNPEIDGDVNEAIPSGNFGHTTGELQANDMMGGVDNTIVGVNDNDAIYNLINFGEYRMAQSEISSPSVSMIIRYGSNVERLLRRISTPERCAELMKKFEFDGKLHEIFIKSGFEESNIVNIDLEMLENEFIKLKNDSKYNGIREYFINNYSSLSETIDKCKNGQGGYDYLKSIYDYSKRGFGIRLSDEEREEILELGLKAYKVSISDELMTMRYVWLQYGRLICPHTANAYHCSMQFREYNKDNNKPILISETASPWKFLAATAVALTYVDPREMAKKYEELRKVENTSEGKDLLLNMIKKAYSDNGREFDIKVIPEDLRNIYEKGVNIGEVRDAKDFGELTLEFVNNIGDIFPKQVQTIIDNMLNV